MGDPWYRSIGPEEIGESLVLARTERGRRFVEAAIESGYLDLKMQPPSTLIASQPNLLKTRGAVWGRITVTRLLGAAAPSYERLPTFRAWLRSLTLREKLGSLLGTARRTFRKGLRTARAVEEWRP